MSGSDLNSTVTNGSDSVTTSTTITTGSDSVTPITTGSKTLVTTSSDSDVNQVTDPDSNESCFFFRPYEEQQVIQQLKGKKPIKISVGSTKIYYQKTPPVQRKTVPTKSPKVHQTLKRPVSTTSLSEVSAVGTTSGKLNDFNQSHRSLVEYRFMNTQNQKSDNDSLDDHWMPDSLCLNCSECGVKFNIITRRHHCRICGRVFCNSCSSHSIPGQYLKPPIQGNIRVCSACLIIFQEISISRSTPDNPLSSIPYIATHKNSSSIVGTTSERLVSPEIESATTTTFTPSIMQSILSRDDRTITDTDVISSPSRSSTGGIEFDNPTPLRRGSIRRSSQISNDDKVLALAEDEVEVRLQEIWVKFNDKTDGLPPQTHRHRFGIRTFPNSYSAQEIVEWLLRYNHAYSREMAVRIGQAFVHTKCLSVVSSTDQVFKDVKDIVLEIGEAGHLTVFPTSPTVADAPNWFLSDDGEDLTSSELPSRVSLHEANLSVEKGQVAFHRHRSNDISTKDFKKKPHSQKTLLPPSKISFDDELTEKGEEDALELPSLNLEPHSGELIAPSTDVPFLHPPPLLQTPVDSTLHHTISFSVVTRDTVLKALPVTGLSQASQFTFQESSIQNDIKQQHVMYHRSHLKRFLVQQLKSFGLSLSWLEVIEPLILEASRKVRTHLYPDDYMDIEYYCKIKKIPGGRKSACSFIHGVVFSKHVTHKKMDLLLRNPQILLLKCAIEFQRRENQLSSFDTLMLQEHEYLKNLVERVKKFQPDIILVQKSVSRFALEILHQHGIVVVVNIKPSVMSRVARSTQGDLLSSLDQLFFDIKLGTCGHFHVRTFTLPDGVRKTLMYFDECEPKLGGVIILQGAEHHELKHVKRVVLFGLQTAHNMRLESSFLADEFAIPSLPMNDYFVIDDDYHTPPSTPELFLHPFSPSILDVPVEQKPQKRDENVKIVPSGTLDGSYIAFETDNVSMDVVLPRVDDNANVNGIDSNDPRQEEEKDEAYIQDESEEEDEEAHTKLPHPPSHTSEQAFQYILKTHLISTSPCVTFSVPYLQTDRGMLAAIKNYLPQVLYWSNCFHPKGSNQYDETVSLNPVYTPIRSRAYSRSRIHSHSSNDIEHSWKHSYKSVSAHPLTSATFLLPASSNEVKAALADFRARASLLDEPNCFFFPSAKKGTDTTFQLKKIFAKSKEFEKKASELEDMKNEVDLVDGEGRVSTPELMKRTKRWALPEREHYMSPLKSKSGEPKPEMVPSFHESMGKKTAINDLSMVLHHGHTLPEPRIRIDDTPASLPSEWSILQEEQLLPNEQQLDCMDPYNHQFISLVFSSTCHDKMKRLYPCVLPCIIPMNYYGRNDIPLGEFLHRYCFRDFYECQSCGVDMMKHQRHFVHSDYEMRISMQQLAAPIPGGDNRIFTWCNCQNDVCSQSTPLVPLADDSLLFSFAKYLEIKFYGSNYVTYKLEDDKPCTCSHPLHTYTQYFSFQDKVAAFELFPIGIFEVRIPPQQVSMVTHHTHIVHHDYPHEINHLGKLVENVFYHIMKYIDIYRAEPVELEVENCLDRCKAMRETLRMKIKRLKDLCITSGIFPGFSNGTDENDKVNENLSVLQDFMAELKRSLTDNVECFNKELFEIDSKLREILNKKDSSPRESATNIPLITTVEQENSSTLKHSPKVLIKSLEKGSTFPATKLMNRVLLLEDSPDYPSTGDSKIGHRRQLSDSATITLKMKEIDSTDAGDSDKILTRSTIESDITTRNFSSEHGINHRKTLHMREQSLPDFTSLSSLISPEGEREGELVQALKEGIHQEHLLSVVYAEDVMGKLRGKDVEDPSKFYHLHSSPISLSSEISSDSHPIKKYTISPVGVKIHGDETDNPVNGVKAAEKKVMSEKLSAFLAKPFQKLPPPFDLTEHHLLRGSLKFQISVYENEPTSIIAYALCSREYAQELKLLVDEGRKSGITESTVSVKPVQPRLTDGEQSTTINPWGVKNIKNYIKKTLQSTSVPVEEQSQNLSDQPDPLEESLAKGDELLTGIKWNSTPDITSKFSSSHEERHISLEFADDTTKFFCKMYYAEEFRKLRGSIFPDGEDRYIRSLARCVKYEAKGGKSRAMFLKTFEDRLIMKQVQMVEITAFVEIAPQYFQHVSEAVKNERPLILAKILGAYSIGFRNAKTGRSKRHHVIIMENLLYGHKCSRVFDLKGSMRGRYVNLDPKKDTKGDVLMDENFLEYIYYSPVYVWPHSKAVLMQAILSDTLFLAKNSIMDYSLLTGLDEEKGELVVGIIDFVRPFTLDKRLEMMLKKAGRSVLPTVVYPDLYRKRFLEAMERYFSPVPDKWTGLGSDIQITL